MGREILFAKTEQKRIVRETFSLEKQHADFLRDLAHKVYKATGYKLSRSEIIRALVEMAMEKNIPPDQVLNYESLKRLLRGG